MFKFSDDQIEAIFKGIWNGTITTLDLPESLYFAIADYLKKGVFEGFGGSMKDFAIGGRDYELLDELRTNIYMFSGAKTYQQTREMTDLLIGADKVKSFPEFKKAARQVHEKYNVNWLEAEYNTAIGQASSAKQWERIDRQRSIFPFLRYKAVMDKNTSTICRPLDGIIAEVDNAIWKRVAPINHWNCRCLLEQYDRYDAENLTPADQLRKVEKQVTKEMDDVFKTNPGIDKVVFNEKHPYFTTVPKEDRKHARNNFGMDIPETDKK